MRGAAECGHIRIKAAALLAATTAALVPGIRLWGPTRHGAAGGQGIAPLASSTA